MATSSPADRDRAGVIAPPPLIFLAFLIAGIVVARKVLPPVEVPYGVVIGAVLVAAALAFAIWAAMTMKRAGTHVDPYQPSTTIVTSGPFRWTRNPLYLSMTVSYIGLALIFHAVTAVILLPVALLVMVYGVIRREETYLQRKFGVEYSDYRRRVRRWL